MKIKTFQAATIQEAYQKIKQELGPNALILSQREVTRPGASPSRFFEVAAATEDVLADDPMEQELRPPEPIRGTYSFPRAAAERPAAKTAPAESTYAPREAPAKDRARPRAQAQARPAAVRTSAAAASSLENSLRSEIADLRRMVFHLSRKTSLDREIPENSPYFDIYQDMLASEVDPWLACKLIDEAGRDCEGSRDMTPEASVYRALDAYLQVSPGGADEKIRAVFYGPTGVGKTTTIAKLAARYALEQGRRVMLMTLDMFRIAAMDQLRTYADIIGIPCVPVKNLPQLREELKRHAAYDVILVDTTGRSPRDVSDLEPFMSWFRDCPEFEKHLVVGATARVADLLHAVDRYEGFGTDSLCITKIDETLSLGHIVNLLVRKKLPVSYLTNGQNVPRDLIVPNSRILAETLVRGNYREGAA